MSIYRSGDVPGTTTSQFITFMRTATGHRRPFSIKRVIMFVALFLAAVLGMGAGLVSMVINGVDIFANGVEVLALVLGGAAVTLMIDVLVRD